MGLPDTEPRSRSRQPSSRQSSCTHEASRNRYLLTHSGKVLSMDVTQLLPLWTAWLRASERSETTVQLRTYHVCRYLSELPPNADPLDLERLVDHLANPRWKPATRRSARTSLRIWTTWFHRTGRIQSDPLSHTASTSCKTAASTVPRSDHSQSPSNL